MELFIFILILSSQTFQFSEAQKGFKVKFTNLICDPNPEWIVNISCKINAINWKTNSIDLSGYTVKPITKLMGHYQMFRRYSGYRPFLFNFTLDACAFYAGKFKSNVLRIFAPMETKYSNVNHKCPFEGYLYLRNFKADVIDFKSIWPAGNYKWNAHLFSDNNFTNKIMFNSIMFNVEEDRVH